MKAVITCEITKKNEWIFIGNWEEGEILVYDFIYSSPGPSDSRIIAEEYTLVGVLVSRKLGHLATSHQPNSGGCQIHWEVPGILSKPLQLCIILNSYNYIVQSDDILLVVIISSAINHACDIV